MSKQVEFFFDVISPNAYLAWTQMPDFIERTGAEIVYRPFFLGGVLKATENQSPAFVPAKRKWLVADMARYARQYGVPLVQNPHFPMMNTLPILRAAHVWRDREDFSQFMAAIWAAVWRDQVNVGDEAELNAALEKGNVNTAEFWERANDPVNKEAVKANTEEAVARGAFGAPTFFVGDELHFGQDRLHFVEDALKA